MSRSLSLLHRGLLGIAVAGTLGFGATQALASPRAAGGPGGPGGGPYCPIDEAGPYYSEPCGYGCPGGIGYCSTRGRCVCGYF